MWIVIVLQGKELLHANLNKYNVNSAPLESSVTSRESSSVAVEESSIASDMTQQGLLRKLYSEREAKALKRIVL